MNTSQSGRWTPYTWEQRAEIVRKHDIGPEILQGDRVENIVRSSHVVGMIACAYLTKNEEARWAKETWPLLQEWRALVELHGVGRVPEADAMRIRRAQAGALVRILDARP